MRLVRLRAVTETQHPAKCESPALLCADGAFIMGAGWKGNLVIYFRSQEGAPHKGKISLTIGIDVSMMDEKRTPRNCL